MITDPTTQLLIARQIQLVRIEQAANHRLVRSAARASNPGRRPRQRWALPTSQRIVRLFASPSEARA